MKQQTAVEFLIDWMSKNQYFIGNDLLKAVEEAKEMEEQQQKSNWMGGYLTCAMKNHNLPYGKEYLNLLADKEIESEQYYNQTFKSE